MTEREEKNNERIGIAVSLSVHVVLLVLFFFIMAWKEPFPPHPEYGIELNFGTDVQGTGQVQPETPATAVTEDVLEEQDEVSEQEPQEQEIDQVVEETEDVLDEELVTQPTESPIQTELNKKKDEQKTEKTEKPAKEEVKESTKKEEPTEAKESASQGDNKEKEGDKGQEDGQLDARALMGQQGGGSGSQLDMAGWQWDYIPKPKDTSDESGRLVFEVKVNDEGEVISVRTLERSVPPSVEKLYRDEIIKLTFSKTSDNTRTAPVSTGKITFIIRSK